MSQSDAERFRTNHGEFVFGNPELENMVNLQAANEFQSATEFFSPSSESNVPASESEELSENETELELFLHEMRDSEFETMTHEMLQELEANFEGYAHQHGLVGELEAMVSHQDFENIANGYFEASIGHLGPNIQSELDSFANHVFSHVPVGSEYEVFRRSVDSYQPVHSENFVNHFIGRIGRGVKGLIKRGLKVVRGVARAVGKLAISARSDVF